MSGDLTCSCKHSASQHAKRDGAIVCTMDGCPCRHFWWDYARDEKVAMELADRRAAIHDYAREKRRD